MVISHSYGFPWMCFRKSHLCTRLRAVLCTVRPNSPTDVLSFKQMEALVRRKCRGRGNRWKQAESICNPPSFLFEQHMGAKWGQCTLHMLAHAIPFYSAPSYTRLFSNTHTHTLEWITSLGLEMKRRKMPASTDATRSYSGGASVFSPLSPFEIHGLCVLLFFMFALEMLCHFGRFYLSASVRVRGLGFVLKSHGNKGWRYNQRGPVVSIFSQGRGVTFTY